MKNLLLVAGFSSLVVAAFFYTLEYTNYNYLVGSVNVRIFPAAFFALLGLLLLFLCVRNSLKTGEN